MSGVLVPRTHWGQTIDDIHGPDGAYPGPNVALDVEPVPYRLLPVGLLMTAAINSRTRTPATSQLRRVSYS
jgi:hypothetical protein